MMMQESLKQEILPENWKRANIVPLYKKGNIQVPLNYKLVSLTNVVCKIMEKIISNEWVSFLEKKNDMISDNNLDLLNFHTRISERLQEREGWLESIYLDLKKNFDRVPHQGLVWNLHNYGRIQMNLLRWMKDLLVWRKMRTVLRGKFSSWQDITSKVP